MIKKIAGMALGGLVMVIVFGYLTAMALTELRDCFLRAVPGFTD